MISLYIGRCHQNSDKYSLSHAVEKQGFVQPCQALPPIPHPSSICDLCHNALCNKLFVHACFIFTNTKLSYRSLCFVFWGGVCFHYTEILAELCDFLFWFILATSATATSIKHLFYMVAMNCYGVDSDHSQFQKSVGYSLLIVLLCRAKTIPAVHAPTLQCSSLESSG